MAVRPLRVTRHSVLNCAGPAGYSWKSNQYGLTIDTVEAYELVLPSGEITSVTAESDPELFFGLKVRCLPRVRKGSDDCEGRIK